MQTSHTLISKSGDRPLLNYWLYLPSGYNVEFTERWPLILFLHGFGERGDSLNDLERVKLHGVPHVLESGRDLPFIVVSPQCSQQSWWTLHTSTLKTLLDAVVAQYPVDQTRIYLTGLSMGGFGAWSLGIAYPDLFAAIAPICGGGVTSDVAALKDVPVWAFHGVKDTVVFPHRSQDMVDALQNAGGDARLTLYPDADHNSWTVTYDSSELYEWFLSHEKPHSG